MAAQQGDDDRILMVSTAEPKSDDPPPDNNSGGNRDLLFSNGVQDIINRLRSTRETIDEKELLDDLLVLWCVLASLLDPLFCYILIVDRPKGCIRLDEKLRVTAIILRSLLDFGYILLVVFKLRNGHSASADNGGFWSIAKKYRLSSLAVDILAVLPLPQVVVLVVFRATKRSHFAKAIRILTIVLLFQLLPRVFRVNSFLKEVKWNSGIVSNSARSKAMFNLILYMIASFGFGAFWYLFSIERKATCLEVRCHSNPYCPLIFNNTSIEKSCMDACSGKASSGDIAAFDFGIFGDAFNSGIVYSTDYMWKSSYCFWWGLQNLSSLGQGLKTSGITKEIYFAVFLTVSGLVLFALLIGNVQTIMQAKVARQEERRLKEEEEKEKGNEKEKEEERREEIKLWLTTLLEQIQQCEKRAEN